MNVDFFKTQWERLRNRFGAKAMDNELMRLVASEVHDMSESGFKRAVDVWIGSRSHLKPPLLSEFREARLAEQKLKFDNDVRGAATALNRKAPGEMRKQLKSVLAKDFGGVESVAQALEVARFNNKLARSEEPDDAG